MGNAETLVANKALAGYTQEAGQRLNVRIQTESNDGSDLACQGVDVGTTEPADWFVSATDDDSTLQGPGTLSVSGYLAGSTTNGPVTVSLDDLKVTATDVAAHAVPVAEIGHEASGFHLWLLMGRVRLLPMVRR
ncbi:hypothetical protein [Arthrobacter sp.]|uniref:hypothetical protein n=1 Tax=Arthrobacter sp. TaxID=1667 RepID=UPI003A9257F0